MGDIDTDPIIHPRKPGVPLPGEKALGQQSASFLPQGIKRPRSSSPHEESVGHRSPAKKAEIFLGDPHTPSIEDDTGSESWMADWTSKFSNPRSGEFRSHTIDSKQISTTFNDVHASMEVIKSLKDLSLPVLLPGEFKFGVLAKSPLPGVLLYGPPGTGKTLLVRALAKESKATMIAISGADIRCSLVGEGEKKIQRLFEFGSQCCPCVIFIDECDTLFGARSRDGNSRGHDNDLAQFLIEMDGIKAKNTRRPIVIAATNRPWDLDEAILRRLGRRVLIDVPSLSGREHILRILLKDETLAEDVDLLEIAKGTHDYTGSDLEKLVVEAALYAIGEIRANGLTSRRVLKRSHFLWASKVALASPKSESVSKIREFHRKYGSSGWNGSIAQGASVVNHSKAFQKDIIGAN